MNYEIFFNNYRLYFAKIKQTTTVDVIKQIISYAQSKGLDNKNIAYILATAYHETAFDFIPKREFGNSAYFIKKYWTNSKVAKWLGNDSAEEAVKYCGRGLVQITGETNYEKFGIANDPEKALEIDTAVRILVDGMIQGSFTGKRLNLYINSQTNDYIGARRIINGNDKAYEIRDYTEKFYQILQKSI
jgi:putative chitinase